MRQVFQMTHGHDAGTIAGTATEPAAPPPVVTLSAPLAGWATALADVPDPVFSGLILGNGVAIDPFDSVLRAPCDGRIVAAHRSRHAVTLQAANGAEILLHVGLDTVSLNGEGFTLHVSEGQAVRTGEPLISFDMDILAHQAKSLLVPVVVLGDGFRLSATPTDRPLSAGETLFTITIAGAPAALPAADAGDRGARAAGEFAVADPAGLHARPAGLIAEQAKRFSARIIFAADGKEADARSPVKLMLLGLTGGDLVRVTAEGTDAEAAVAAMQTLITSAPNANTPNAKALPVASTPPVASAAAPLPPLAAGEHASFKGVQAVSGVATGKARQYRQEALEIAEVGTGSDAEMARLESALEHCRRDIGRDIEAARAVNRQQAEILKAHLAFLDDPDLVETARALIVQDKSAAFAWRSAAEGQAAALKRLGNALLAERAVDLQDVGRRVQLTLAGKDGAAGISLPPGSILLADDLLPSQLTGATAECLAGLCLAEGGPTSHVAILAATLGIPTLVATGPDIRRIEDGTDLILDADHCTLEANPPADRLAETTTRIEKRRTRLVEAKARAQEDCTTADGARIEVVANLASPSDALIAVANGAEGCGLLRSEFLFLNRDAAPSEEEQLAQYQTIADTLGGRPLIVRTLDAGADKVLPFLDMPQEANPALGLRGVRTSLWKPETLRTQLRAILRVRPQSQCRIMVPMVTTLDELRAVRAMLDEERQALGLVEPTPLGVMVEVPSAALMADVFAAECDFFSIGTNDLTQYTLAMDRMNPGLAKRVDAFDPAVLRLIAQTTEGAAKHGRWTGICGGLASVPLAAPVLIGLGVTELSATASMVPEIKAMVRTLDLAQCTSIAREALRQDTAQAVRHLLSTYWPEV